MQGKKEEIVSALHNAAARVREQEGQGTAYRATETLTCSKFNVGVQGNVLRILRHAEEDYRVLANSDHEYDAEDAMKSYVAELKRVFQKTTGKRLGLKQVGKTVTEITPLSGVRMIIKTTCQYEISRLKEKGTSHQGDSMEQAGNYLSGLGKKKSGKG